MSASGAFTGELGHYQLLSYFTFEGIVKLLLQRVTEATVSINNGVLAKINHGLVVFAGVARGDSEKDAERLVEKVINLRIFSDEEGKLNYSVLDIRGDLLVVSQFTLLALTRRGRRPDFSEAAPPVEAEALLERFVELARSTGLRVETGRFRQHMLVEIHNDGPVTIILDSKA